MSGDHQGALGDTGVLGSSRNNAGSGLKIGTIVSAQACAGMHRNGVRAAPLLALEHAMEA